MRSVDKILVIILFSFILLSPFISKAYNTSTGIEQHDIVDINLELRSESTGEIIIPVKRILFDMSSYLSNDLPIGNFEVGEGLLRMKVGAQKSVFVGSINPAIANESTLYRIFVYVIVERSTTAEPNEIENTITTRFETQTITNVSSSNDNFTAVIVVILIISFVTYFGFVKKGKAKKRYIYLC